MIRYIILTLLLLPLLLVWLYLYINKTYKLAFSRMVNVKTGALMPGFSHLQSLYGFLVRRYSLGPGEIALYESNKFGGIFRFSLFGHPSVSIADPTLVKQVLKNIDTYIKTSPFDVFGDIVKMFGKRSIININQPEWHNHRSLLNKAFISNKIFFQPMQRKVLECASLWRKREQVKVSSDLQKLTLDVLATCIFGQDFDTLNGNQSEPLAAYNYAFESIFNPIRLIFPWTSSIPLPSNIKLKQKISEFDDYCWSIISKAKKNVPNQTESQTQEDDAKCVSLIQLMINGGMKDQDIRDNVSLFFLAGHETTASTLSWAIGLLASYPEIQKKARIEVLEKTKDGLTYESLKDLVYIDWFIHETMRMYPAAPVVGQRSTETETIIGDWKIPEKTIIQINLISMLNDPQIWGDPRTFRPERWSLENLTKAQRSAWMPFSYGPRVCIGMNFSLLEQKIFLATLLREFSHIELAKTSKLEVNYKGILYAPDPDKLKINFVT